MRSKIVSAGTATILLLTCAASAQTPAAAPVPGTGTGAPASATPSAPGAAPGGAPLSPAELSRGASLIINQNAILERIAESWASLYEAQAKAATKQQEALAAQLAGAAAASGATAPSTTATTSVQAPPSSAQPVASAASPVQPAPARPTPPVPDTDLIYQVSVRWIAGAGTQLEAYLDVGGYGAVILQESDPIPGTAWRIETIRPDGVTASPVGGGRPRQIPFSRI